MICSGLYTPLITPFRDNKLDEEGLKQNIARQKVCTGIVALGTTGETPTLTENEKTRILEIAKESGQTLIVGCSHSSTEALLEQVQHYEMADALLVASPAYNKPTQEGLYRHFSMVAEKSPKPIILYNIPGRTSVNIEPETIARLKDKVIGIKECNILQAPTTIATGVPVLAGDDAWILPLIALGAKGAIAAGGNVVPEQLNALVELALDGDYETAREIHFKLLPLFKAGSWESNPIPYKGMMELMGLPSGDPRMPLLPFSDKTRLQKVLCALDS